MKTVTEEQVRAQFCVHDIKEALQQIKEMQEKEWTQETALDMMCEIIDALNEHARTNGESIDNWNFTDRLTWAIKEAYIGGFIRAFRIAFESNEMGICALFGEGATA